MSKSQLIFLIINILGGIAVLSSYYFGLKSNPDGAALWGGVPENSRKIYVISMLFSAVSYFIFTSFIILKVLPKSGAEFHILYALILLASALWMPLTTVLVAEPTAMIWFGVRAVLAIVALSSASVLYLLMSQISVYSGVHYWLSIVGLVIFTLHTGVLDAIIWPMLWRH